MSVIAIEGFPLNMTLNHVVRMLTKYTQCNYKALNFLNSDNSPHKTCYLKVSDGLDTLEVVERINTMVNGRNKNVINAFVPETIPDLPKFVRPLKVPKKLRKQLGISGGDLVPAEVLSLAHFEIMTELQYKYTRLCALSSKNSHTLLEAIGKIIQTRLKELQASGEEESSSTYKLTERYRKVHPHFGDFQLILDTLHLLEDGTGVPHTQLEEADLIVMPQHNGSQHRSFHDSRYEKNQVSKYTARIMKKLEQHVNSYDLTANPGDSKEKAVRKRVQAQLAKMVPHLPTIMNEIVTGTYVENKPKINTRKSNWWKIRIYGEPGLPGDELMLPLLKRYSAFRISRRKSMYNLVAFDVPAAKYHKILKLDGSKLGQSKIVVRPSNVSLHRVGLTKENAEESKEVSVEEVQDG